MQTPKGLWSTFWAPLPPRYLLAHINVLQKCFGLWLHSVLLLQKFHGTWYLDSLNLHCQAIGTLGSRINCFSTLQSVSCSCIASHQGWMTEAASTSLFQCCFQARLGGAHMHSLHWGMRQDDLDIKSNLCYVASSGSARSTWDPTSKRKKTASMLFPWGLLFEALCYELFVVMWK